MWSLVLEVLFLFFFLYVAIERVESAHRPPTSSSVTDEQLRLGDLQIHGTRRRTPVHLEAPLLMPTYLLPDHTFPTGCGTPISHPRPSDVPPLLLPTILHPSWYDALGVGDEVLCGPFRQYAGVRR